MNVDQNLVKAREGICGIGEPHMVRDRTIAVEKKGPHTLPPARLTNDGNISAKARSA